MPLLYPGDAFPQLSLNVPGGQTVQVPEAFAGQYGVLLINRGAWCPYCNTQLCAFQRASATLADAAAAVASLSVDDEATTAELIAREPRLAAGRRYLPTSHPEPASAVSWPPQTSCSLSCASSPPP